jgi:hypothetical protein
VRGCVDPRDAVVILTGGVGSRCKVILDTRVVIGGIVSAKDYDRRIDHGFDLSVIGNVAADGDSIMVSAGQLVDRISRGAIGVANKSKDLDNCSQNYPHYILRHRRAWRICQAG